MPNINREQRHLSAFRELIDLDNDIAVKKHETPDFLFQIDGKLIGVEHTEVYLDKEYPLQAKESVEDDIADKAQSYADSKGYIPTRTKILFRNVRGLKQKQRKNIASNLADFVQFNILQSSKEPFTQLRLELDSPVISSVYPTVMPKDFKNHYFTARAGWVKADASEEISKAVRVKSKKVNSYLSKCDEVWLLIVADGFNPSSLLGEGGNICPLESLAGFKKVYFMSYAAKILLEVPVEKVESKNG